MPSSSKINTSRGKMIDQKNLKFFLTRRKKAGAALDVYEEETPKNRNFLKIPILICTPHIAGSFRETTNNMGLAAINNSIKMMK